MDPLADFTQLELHFVDQVQWRYEVIRPIVLFDDRSAVQRAVETHTHPETVRKLTRRFQQQGTLGLFPEHTEIVSPSRGQQVPDEVVEELARLKAHYEGFQFRELARIIQCKCNYSIDDKTVKKLWQQSPGPVQGELPFGTYHSHPQRYDARLQVIKLYYQGWNKLSISRFLKVSRPTVDLWIRRFEAEHFAGLEDKSRTPHAPESLVSADGRGLSPPEAPSRCGSLPHRESAGPRHDFRTHAGTDHGTQQASVR